MVSTGLPGLKEAKNVKDWAPFFCPKAFLKANPAPKPNNFALSDEELLQLG